jgi:hypothetical protein
MIRRITKFCIGKFGVSPLAAARKRFFGAPAPHHGREKLTVCRPMAARLRHIWMGFDVPR